MVVLRSLGTAEIDTGTTVLMPTHTITFAAALYLVLERARKVQRAELAGLLWPNVIDDRRGHRLRQTILQLKHAGLPLKVDRNTVGIDGEVLNDIDAIEVARDLAAVPALSFLPGYDPVFSAPFTDWVDRKRAGFHASMTQSLTNELIRARSHGDWSVTRRLGHRCLEIDPVNETAVLALAEEAVMRGGKREGVAILDRYLEEIGSSNQDIRLPATILRRRIRESVSERPPYLPFDPPFLGRQTEMEWMLGRLKEARNGTGVAALVVGEAGIGKSRLCSELAKFAILEGVSVQRVGCRPGDVDRPLSVLVDLVPSLREMPGALGCAQDTLLDLKRLTEFDKRGESTMPSDPADALGRIRFALHDLFDAVTDELCVLVVIEDVQWLDSTSMKMLAGIVEKAAEKRLFFLFNSRPADGTFERALGGRLRTLRLDPLSDAAASELLGSITSNTPNADNQEDLINRCLPVGEGNPFFLQELGKQCLDTGGLEPIPTSIATVLNERLSRLESSSLLVLQACAVLADNSTVARIEKMLQLRPYELMRAMSELNSMGMLRGAQNLKDSAQGSELRSRHDLLSAAALRRIGAHELAYLHARSGEVLEDEAGTDLLDTSLLWACALHWHHSGDRDKALTLSTSCANHLLAVGLSKDAKLAFEKSLEYCATEKQRLEVLSQYSIALQVNGDWERSVSALRTCQEYHRAVHNAETSHNDFELRCFDACARITVDEPALLLELLPCVTATDADPEHRVAAAAIALKLASNAGNLERMDDIYSQVEALLSDVGLTRPAMEVHMIYHSLRGNRSTATHAADRFLDASRSQNNPVVVSRALVNCAHAYRLAGKHQEAGKLLSAALEHCLATKMDSRIGVISLALVNFHLAAGEIPQARQALRTAGMHRPASDEVVLQVELEVLEMRVRLEEGDLDGAEAAYHRIELVQAETRFLNATAIIALKVSLLVAQTANEDALRPWVDLLESRHLLSRACGLQDFETTSLVKGRSALGEGDRAYQILFSYFSEYRREPGSPARELIDLLAALMHELPPMLESTLRARTEYRLQDPRAIEKDRPNPELTGCRKARPDVRE